MTLGGARVGWAGGTMLADVDAVRAEACWAAEAGFDGFWVSQIFGVDPVVALAAVGAEVPQLAELGTSVVPLYGRHPLALAAMALTAQSALGGRFTLGLGASHQPFVEVVLGESHARPFTRTSEYLDALVPLLEGRAAGVDGREVRAQGSLAIRAEPVPVLLAALGPRMLELAGRVTAGTSVGQCGPRTLAGHVVPSITAAARAAGRPPPRVMALVNVCVTDDPAGVRERARSALAGYGRLPSYRAMLDREPVGGPEDLVLAGSPDEVRAGLERYVAAGATDLRIGAGPGTEGEMEGTRRALPGLLAG
jgi:F420-dependent oxidoreductase-like protein